MSFCYHLFLTLPDVLEITYLIFLFILFYLPVDGNFRLVLILGVLNTVVMCEDTYLSEDTFFDSV